MKELLTSGGLTNEILWTEFFRLIDKPPRDIHIAFIDTASKVEKDRSWIDSVLHDLREKGIQNITVIDIAEPRKNWEGVLAQANVIWVEGGNTFYLLDKLRSSKLTEQLKEIAMDKVYVGVSAGSIVVTPSIEIASVEPADSNDVGMTDFTGLGWVDFEISPHTNSDVSLSNVETYAQKSGRLLYAYDDNVALKIVDGVVDIVGPGFSKVLNSV